MPAVTVTPFPEDRRSGKPLVDKLRKMTRPVMVQIAPGRWAPVRTATPPEVSICNWRANGDGTFQPIPVHERFTRLNRQLAAALGLPGQYKTLLQLGHAGFIETVYIAPHCCLINLDSYYNHLRRCAEDREFWAPGCKNRQLYSQSIF